MATKIEYLVGNYLFRRLTYFRGPIHSLFEYTYYFDEYLISGYYISDFNAF